MTVPQPAAMVSLLASASALRMTRLFGFTCVLIEALDPNTGWIYSGPMPPQAGSGSRQSVATVR